MSLPQVLDRSSADGSGLIRWNCQVAFLDEFRIMVVLRDNFPHAPELSVVNTFLPQDHPRRLRRFGLPPEHNLLSACVHLDCNRSFGTIDRDSPLIVDPTQAILIMDLSLTVSEPHVRLILRMQPLIEHACSMRTEVQIPWDEWGRDAVVTEIPINCAEVFITIHGTRVLAIRETHRGPEEHYYIHVFDFSRRANAALPLLDSKIDVTERKVASEGGQSCIFEGGEGTSAWNLRSLGDSLVFYKVSILPKVMQTDSPLRDLCPAIRITSCVF